MITFETQEDFENAVMRVLRSRLSIGIRSNDSLEIAVTLYDVVGGNIDSDSARIS